jgi:Rrf2 family protein
LPASGKGTTWNDSVLQRKGFLAVILLSRRSLLSIAAVVDIALHARPQPVSAKMLAARHDLPPRHLETVLQALVRHGILKGIRGPRGGYELAKERRRVTAGDVVRAAMSATGEDDLPPLPHSRLVDEIVGPEVKAAGDAFLARLDGITVEDLCKNAEQQSVFGAGAAANDFTV